MRSFFFGNWVTRGYIVAVLVAALSSALPAARIGLIVLSAPVAVIFAPIYLLGTGWMIMPMMVLSVVTGVLLNTLVLNTIVGHAAGGRHRPRLSGARSGRSSW